MQTLLVNRHYCSVLSQEIEVEELYSLAGTNTCQIDTQLVSWHCLARAVCPSADFCPLFVEYADTGAKSQLER